MPTSVLPRTDDESDVYVLNLGVKSVQEVIRDGVPGLLLQGYASRFHEIDQAGEHQTKGAFADIADSWGAEREPIIRYQHGADPVLGNVRLGKALEYRVDDEGLYIEAFVPRDPPAFTDMPERKKSRYQQVYEGIKKGAIRGLSVGGNYIRDATGAIRRWSTGEISVTDRPCLASATFTLGTKAIADRYGVFGLPTSGDPADMSVDDGGTSDPPPILTRTHWTQAMQLAQGDGDAGLHDHLIHRPPETQGTHNAGSCAICTPRRGALGMKSDGDPGDPGEQDLEEDDAGDDGGGDADAGAKALTKTEGGEQFPPSSYLVRESEQKPSTWHLRVKDAAGKPDHRLMGAAAAALGPKGYRGNRYEGPQKQDALGKLKALYRSEDMDYPDEGGGDTEAKTAGKSALDHLIEDRPDLYHEALALLTTYEHGEKIGRKHSKKDREVIKGVVAVLGTHFLADDPDNDGDNDSGDTDDDASSSPTTSSLAAAGTTTGS